MALFAFAVFTALSAFFILALVPSGNISTRDKSLLVFVEIMNPIQHMLGVGAPYPHTIQGCEKDTDVAKLAELRDSMDKASNFLYNALGKQMNTTGVTRKDAVANTVPVSVYSSAEVNRAEKIIVYIHGGGFVQGSVMSHEGLCQELTAGTGYDVVSVGYRLAPEHKFPSGLEDVVASLAWTAATYPPPTALVVSGDSAGGNLAIAALLHVQKSNPAVFQRVALLLPLYPVADATCLGCTASYVEYSSGYLLSLQKMAWFFKMYMRTPADVSNVLFSPLLASKEDLKGFPRTVVVTAEYDPLRDEGEAMARKMKEAGADARYVRYAGALHGFASVPLGGHDRVVQDLVDIIVSE